MVKSRGRLQPERLVIVSFVAATIVLTITLLGLSSGSAMAQDEEPQFAMEFRLLEGSTYQKL